MNQPDKIEGGATAGRSDGDGATSESNLGYTLALIHRALAHLDDASRAMTVQDTLLRACDYLDRGRHAHAKEMGVAAANVATSALEAEIAAVIAAAVAVVVGRPHRLVSVQPATPSAPYMNVWALEGRTQIFMSHKVR
jgi:hypothetical protein